ncbi:MAG: penicillin-binding protein 2, partial [Pseudobutyrivibrio sp.]|nr:penicillin-binding protein 2 [Pseudobutyrivibrio sp.]
MTEKKTTKRNINQILKSITEFLSKNSDKKDKSKAHIAAVAYVFMGLFIAMGVYFAHFIKVDSEDFIYNDYNSRFSTFADTVIRGDILTSDGKIIATTKVNEEGQEVREYPYGELFSHTVGYVTNGSAGLEAEYSLELLKSSINGDVKLKNNIDGVKNPGDNLYTTLDYKTQIAARDALGYYRGAIVAMDPETGKIIAMVSKPDFDPNTLSEYWEFVADKENNSSVLLNRATNGMYPPGSTFKIVTALSFMRQDENY